MTHEEFFKRTGIQTTEEEFLKINLMYLESGQNMDKDTFCADYKKHHESLLLNIFFERACRLEEKLDLKRSDIVKLVNMLLLKASEYKDEDMQRRAVEIFGQANVIKRKAHLNLPLNEEERDYLIQNLK